MGLFDSMLSKGRRFSDPGKYVDDFRIEEHTDEKGRIRREAVYTGLWTVLRDRGTAVRARLWISLAGAVLIAVLHVLMLLIPHGAAGDYLVMIPVLAALFPELHLQMGCLSLPFRGRPMRRDQYMHSFIRASRSAVAVGILMLSAAAASLIRRAVQADWLFFPGDRFFLSGCAAVTALCAAVLILLRGIDLTERENAAFPAGSGKKAVQKTGENKKCK